MTQTLTHDPSTNSVTKLPSNASGETVTANRTFQVKCSRCGEPVSSPHLVDVVINGFVECPQCIVAMSKLPEPVHFNHSPVEKQTRKPPVLFYHVAQMGNWKAVVREQLDLLKQAGFDGKLMIGMCGNSYSRFPHEYACSIGVKSPEIIARSMTLDDYEFPTLRALENFVRNGYVGAVGYFHTKGVSAPGDSKKLWRWIMNRVVLTEWKERVAELDTHDATGFCWESPPPGNIDHFCGNFWWARSDWIKKLSGIDWYISNPWNRVERRLTAEFWISSNNLRHPQRRIKSVYVANQGSGETPIWKKEWWDARPDMVAIANGRPRAEVTAGRTKRLRAMFDGKSVAVVGNAHTVVHFDNGPAIDACDVVVRFNHFSTKEHAKRVGARTDVICTGSNPYRESRLGDNEQIGDATVIVTSPRDNDCSKMFSDRVPPSRLHALPSDYAKTLERQLGALPTTGITFLSYLLDECSPKSVFLTGFSFEKLAKSHYFDDEPFDYKNHCPIKEKILFSRKYRPNIVSVDPHIERVLYTGQPCFEYQALQNRKGRDYSQPHQKLYQEVCKHVQNKSVLEIGGGIGWGARQMLKAQAAEIVLIEPEQESANYLAEILPDLELHREDFLKLPIERHFDLVVCIEVLEHLPPVGVHPFLCKAIQLAPRLLLSTPDRNKSDHGRFSPTEVRLILAAAGFDRVSSKSLDGACFYDAEKTNHSFTC